jgi:hypothetical protein
MFQVGVNSWISIADADEYFNDIWDGSFWSSLSLANKKKLLITANKWILSAGYSISPSSTSQKVKDAQCELAIEVYNSYDEYKKRKTLYGSGVRSFNFNGWSETLKKAELPVNVADLLEDFASNSNNKFFNLSRDYD